MIARDAEPSLDRVVIVHAGLANNEMATRHERGWQSILAECVDLLAEVKPR